MKSEIVRVKVCGVRSKSDALMVASLGADAVGFIHGIEYRSEDEVPLELIREAVTILPPFVSPVLVTHVTEPESIAELVRETQVSAVQVHNYVSPEDVISLSSMIPGVKIIKAVHVTGDEALEVALEYEKTGVVDSILLDTRTEDRIGGTGKTHDWSVSRRIVGSLKIPVILAGGLNPENVREAVEFVRPYGVDANSGTKGKDGFKDPEKVRGFVFNAKNCGMRFCSR